MTNCTIKSALHDKLPFIFSCLDRDEFSASYGCFDRLYWGWKLKDYSDLTLQRLVYPMLWLQSDSRGLNNKVVQWAVASFRFVSRKLHDDGAVDQAFFGEHSHAGTGFLLLDFLKAYELIKSYLSEDDRQMIQQTCQSMAHYVSLHDEKHGLISNHLLGVAASLLKYCQLFEPLNKQLENAAEKFIARVLGNQSTSGGLTEYQGVDPGYQSLAVFYLANIYRITGKDDHRRSLFKAIEFISYFAHPDFSFGGEYGARNTEVLYVGGMAIVSNEFPVARSMVNFYLKSFAFGSSPSFDSVDVENLSPLLSSTIELVLNGCDLSFKDCNGLNLPYLQEFTKDFHEHGLFIFSTKELYAVVSIFKGGVLKVFSKLKRQVTTDHCGFVINKKSTIYSTQYFEPRDYNYKDGKISFDVGFRKNVNALPSTLSFLLLKAYYLLFHRSYWLRELPKKLLAGMLLKSAKDDLLKARCVIAFSDAEVVIRLVGLGDVQIISGKKFSSMHMASSKYFQSNQI